MELEEYTPGSQEWHFAIAEELHKEAKSLSGEDKKYKEELADFHRLIGENQPKAGK